LSRRDTTLNELNLPLAFLSRRDNHHLAATAKMALLIAANFSSRMSRYKRCSKNENKTRTSPNFRLIKKTSDNANLSDVMSTGRARR
jgi:hypothetical protein